MTNALDQLVKEGKIEVQKIQDGHLYVKHCESGQSYIWGGCDEKTGEAVLIGVELQGEAETKVEMQVGNFSQEHGTGSQVQQVPMSEVEQMKKDNDSLVALVHSRDEQIAALQGELEKSKNENENASQYIDALEKQINDLEAKIQPQESESKNEVQSN